MRQFYLLFLFFTLLNMVSTNSFAQYYNPKYRYTSLGFSVKASYFDGDIATPIQYIRPGFGAHVTRRMSPRVSIMSELMWLRVMGDDVTGSNLESPNKTAYYIRNLNFRNDIKELSLCAKLDLFPSTDHYTKRPIYNLYGMAGLSFFYHNPKALIYKDSTFTKKEWVALRSQRTENVSYSNFQIAVPLAVGLRYKVSLQWDMEIELGYRITFTDFLDDVSGAYPDPASLESDRSRQLSNRTAEQKSALSGNDRDLSYIQNTLGYPIVNASGTSYVQDHGPGSQRGTKKGPDRFIVFGIRFLYVIPKTINCPKYREF
jgi:hypothetical protein